MYKIYQVGGSVRDELIGNSPKDIDYLIVYNESVPANEAFEQLQTQLKDDGHAIFAVVADRWTIRTKFPRGHPQSKLIADFQLAVADGYTTTLADNLRDRDFTINAMAKDIESGKIIDLFNGVHDLENRKLACPVSAEYSFSSDPIRLIRALRFGWIDGYDMDNGDIWIGISRMDVNIFYSIDLDRLRRELQRMFKENTAASIEAFIYLRELNRPIYNFIVANIRLNPVINGKV